MADVKVRIIAVDEASGPISKAGDEVEKTGKKAKEAGNAFEGMGKTMVSIAGALGLQMGLQAIVGGLKNAVVGSFELAAALEQTKVGFTTMLGSGEAAQGMLNELRDFAAKTPFQFTDLTKAASRMIAMGTAAEDVIPTLTAVGDAAAGLGLGSAGVDRITLALNQMGAKGKIAGDDLRQLAEAGVPALRYLADAAGVSTAEMQKMIEKGVVPAAEGVKVLVQSMEGDFGGLMAEQSKTATGALSNLEDATATLGTVIGGKFLDDVERGATGLAEFEIAVVAALTAGEQNAKMVGDLKEALNRGAISQEQFNELVDKGSVASRGNYNATKTSVDMISNFELATLLLAEAEAQYVYDADRAADSTTGNITVIDKLVARVDAAKDAVLQLKEALALQASSAGLVSGALKEFDTDTLKLAETTAKHQKIVDDLTAAHGKNQAAILAGNGTIKDNSAALEKSSIAHRDLKQDVQQLNDKQADGKISGEDYTLAMDKLNIKIRDQDIEHQKLVATQGTGLTATQLAAVETGNYTTKLGEATKALEADKAADILLQTQVATRIKEGILLEEIALAAKNGFTDAEIALIDATAEALGVADSEAVQGAINTGIAATTLAGLRAEYEKDFEEGNAEGIRLFGVGVDQLGSDITNKLRPSMKSAEDSIADATAKLKAFADTFNGLNSKEITLTYREVRIKDEVVLQNQAMAAAGVAVSEPGMAAVVNVPTGGGGGTSGTNSLAGAMAVGGPVMGGAGAYLVGERGPELFNPSGTGGTITPNNALGRSGLAIGTLNVYGVQSTSELFNQLSREARARGLQFAVN